MDASKDIRSDSVEPYTSEDCDNGSFFRKYTLLTPQDGESVDQPIFKRYVPLRIDSNEYAIDRPTPEDSNSFSTPTNVEPIKQHLPLASPFLLCAAVVLAVLILAGLYMFLRASQPGEQAQAEQRPASEASADGVNSVAENGGLQIPQEADSQSPVSVEERAEVMHSAGLNRATIRPQDLLLNIMLARAREFEDRGMLVKAEEEYRAAVSNFPQDKLSQTGLKRVQTVISEKQKSEMSTVSRETGLREFRMSDFAAAERNLSAAVNAGRTDTATLFALGMSYLKLGSFTQAQSTLEQCTVSSPDYAPALVGLAQVNAATGRKKEALPLLQRALDLGGGAEFTPAKIKEMIFRLSPEQPAVIDSEAIQPAVQRSQPNFYSNVTHVHDLLLSSCKGELFITNSVVHFNSPNQSHSFHVLLSEVTGAHVKGKELQFNANGKFYRFNLNGRSPRDFLDALVR
jgi:tetratricopeptide (TPR) repeat protein